MTPDRVVLDPFGPTADAAAYVARPATERVLDALAAWAVGDQPVALLTGPPGIGKTLVLRVLERRLEAVCRAVTLPYAALSVGELCGWALGLLGEPAPTAGDAEAAFAASAARFARSGRPLLLVVDDASAMPADTVRRLRGMAEASDGALRVLACGLELAPPDAGAAATQDPHGPDAWIREFGRDTPRFRLADPMSEDETWRYLRTRLETSVAPPEVVARFDGKTSARLHRASGGIPRELHGIAGELLRLGEQALAAKDPPATAPAPATTPVAPPPPAAKPPAPPPAPTLTPTRVVLGTPPASTAAAPTASPPAATPTSPAAEASRPAAVAEPEDDTPLPVARTAAARPRAEAPPPVSVKSVVETPVAAAAASEVAEAAAPAAPSRRVPVSRPRAQRVERAPGRGELALVAAGLVALAIAVPFVLSVLGREAPPSAPPEAPGETRPAEPSAPAAVTRDVQSVPAVAAPASAPPALADAAPVEAAPPALEPPTGGGAAVRPAEAVAPEPALPAGAPPAPGEPAGIAGASSPPPTSSPLAEQRTAAEPVTSPSLVGATPPGAEGLPSVEVPEIAGAPPSAAPSEVATGTPSAGSPTPDAVVPPEAVASPAPAVSAAPAPSSPTQEPVVTPPANPSVAPAATPTAMAPAAPAASAPVAPIPIAPVRPAPVAAPPPTTAVATPSPPAPAGEPSPPAAAEGEPVRVNVNATPWAWVTVDGIDLGETPLSGVLLRSGEHEFTARMPDGRVVKRKILVNAENRFIGFD